jgi:hypothetical protein
MFILQDELKDNFNYFNNFSLNGEKFQIFYVSTFSTNRMNRGDLFIYIFDKYSHEFHQKLITKMHYMKSSIKTLLIYNINSDQPLGHLLENFVPGEVVTRNFNKHKKMNDKNKFRSKFKVLKKHFTASEIVYFFNRVKFPEGRREHAKNYIVKYFEMNQISADDIWLLYSYGVLDKNEIIPLIANMKYGWWFENNITDLFSIYEKLNCRLKYPNDEFFKMHPQFAHLFQNEVQKKIPFSSLF